MTSATQTAHGFQWARLGRPAAYLLGIATPAAVFTALAFGTARGEAVEVSRDSYDTSGLVLNFSWWWAAYLLVVPVFLVARRYPRLAAVGAFIAAVPQFITAYVYVVRFGESGWGDGLESFAYLYAFSMTILFAGAAVLGLISGRRSRQRAQERGGATLGVRA